MFSASLSGKISFIGGGIVFAADLSAAENDINTKGFITTVTSAALVADITGLFSAGLLTSAALAVESGATTVAFMGASVALPEILALAAAVGAMSAVFGAVGLLPKNFQDDINSFESSLFSKLFISDTSSDPNLQKITITAKKAPTIISDDETTETDSYTFDGGVYKNIKTYTDSTRTNISSDVSIDTDSLTGHTTVTTINYNPNGLECTFDEKIINTLNSNALISDAAGTESASGVIKSLTLSGSEITTSIANSDVTVSSGTTIYATGKGNTFKEGEDASCLDSWDHVPVRSWPLFKARHVLRTLLLNDNLRSIS